MQTVSCLLHNYTWIRQHLLRKAPRTRPCVGGAASEHAAGRPQESSPKAGCGSRGQPGRAQQRFWVCVCPLGPVRTAGADSDEQ